MQPTTPRATLRNLTALSAALLLGACASGNRIGAGASLGTTGLSGEVKYAPSETIMLRGAVSNISVSGELESAGVIYDGDFDMTTVAGFVDLAPFSNGFVLSGGAYLGDKGGDLVATPSQNVEIGGQVFTPEEVGSLFGDVSANDFAPYLGLGYDGFMRHDSPWSFNARAGVMFTGSPEVELTSANGLLSDRDVLRTELENEVRELESDAEDFKYFPVVTVGVTRRF